MSVKKLDIPTYAQVISIGIPMGYALTTLILVLLGLPAGASLAAIVLGTPPAITLFLVLNGLISILGARIARSKGRKFGTFYFLGLLFPIIPTLISLVLKPRTS
jgi:hypothetical protein